MANKIMQLTVQAFLAVCGSLARQLSQKGKTRMKIAAFTGGCFIAAFTGVMVYFIAEYFQMDRNLACIAAGVSGWAGPQALDLISATVIKKASALANKAS